MLTQYQRAKCKLLRDQGKTYTRIAALVGTTRKTAIKWANRSSEDSLRDKPRSGRPRTTTPKQDHRILRKATAGNRRASVRRIALESETTSSGAPSSTTIWRRLKEAGLQQFQPSKKPVLTTLYKQKRLKFARENRRRDWRDTLFHDERKFILGPPKKKVWRRRGEVYIEGSVKHPVSINVWACFGKGGYGRISIYRENLTKQRLKDILKEHLMPSLAQAFPAGRPATVLSYHDNDRKYTSELVQNYLEKHDIVNAGQPPGSPDLNPIENLFGIWATQVSNTQPKTTAGFYRVIRREWENLPRSHIFALVNSMPDRMKDVIEAKGGHTKW